jgi:hypothetical protein
MRETAKKATEAKKLKKARAKKARQQERREHQRLVAEQAATGSAVQVGRKKALRHKETLWALADGAGGSSPYA